MELYASSLLIFVCVSAAKLPTIMVKRAQIHTIDSHRLAIGSNAVMYTRMNRANAAAFGPADMKAATGAGAPWYTSGAHTWKGAAEILNAKPTNINAADTPTSDMEPACPAVRTRRISTRFVEPVSL